MDALPLALPPIVYVMTDLGESTLEDWEANPELEDERFDFARFDVDADRTLHAAPARDRARHGSPTRSS